MVNALTTDNCCNRWWWLMADGIQFILKLFIIISLTESEWIEKCAEFAFHFMKGNKNNNTGNDSEDISWEIVKDIILFQGMMDDTTFFWLNLKRQIIAPDTKTQTLTNFLFTHSPRLLRKNLKLLKFIFWFSSTYKANMTFMAKNSFGASIIEMRNGSETLLAPSFLIKWIVCIAFKVENLGILTDILPIKII